MKNDLLKITNNIYSYSHFVNKMECCYGWMKSWEKMEILNSLALNDWEEDAKPIEWNKWDLKYKNNAIELLKIFLLDVYSGGDVED